MQTRRGILVLIGLMTGK